MNLVLIDRDGGKVFIGYDQTIGAIGVVEFGADLQATACPPAADEVDDDRMTDEWAPRSVHSYARKHTVLYHVPRFRLAGDDSLHSPGAGADGTVYVGMSNGKLYAIAPDGTQRWVVQAGLGGGAYGPVSVGSDGTIYVAGIVASLSPPSTRAGANVGVTSIPTSCLNRRPAPRTSCCSWAADS